MVALLLAVLPAIGCGAGAPPAHEQSMIVLGIDGMDYGLTRQLIDEGRLPNLQRLADSGGFQPLETSVPPQSPVAWSDFITGLDAGGHGIFDFLHRDPETLIPYESTSRLAEGGRTLTFGKYAIPISGGGMESLRKGTPFWEVLEANGVPTTIMRMPANFPPSGTASRELSGMGTPDIQGTLGEYSFFTTQPERIAADAQEQIQLQRVAVQDGVVESELIGPANPVLVEAENLTAPFTVYVDPDNPVALIVVGSSEVILEVGEWSDWIDVQFEVIPYVQSIGAMARFHLMSVRPEFELYVSPLNLDPLAPAMPVTAPASYATELAEATGRFYTQGMPEDTNALADGVFDNAAFMAQAAIAHREIREQFDYVLDNFEGGFLFYYFGNLDQVSHMMWRTMDAEHPAHDPVADAPFADAIIDRYLEVDELVGATLERISADTTLVIMSDHGFTSWRRQMNLNTWLLEEGYIRLNNRRRVVGIPLFGNVNWSRTQAYAIGLNGLYINLRGRERFGTVVPSDRDNLLEELRDKLLAYRDPDSGEPAITKVYISELEYTDGGYLDIGPDMQVGFAKGTALARESALGEFSEEIIWDNTDAWSGDHLMDHEAVPGVLLTNRPLGRAVTALNNLAAALLAEFGTENFPPPATNEEQ